MKITNNLKKSAFDEGTSRLVVCNECFATSNKVVHTKTDERALAAEGAQ